MGAIDGVNKTVEVQKSVEVAVKTKSQTTQNNVTTVNNPNDESSPAFNGAARNVQASVTGLKLHVQFTANQTQTRALTSEPVDQDKIDYIKDRLADAGFLANVLNSQELPEDLQMNQSEKNRLVGDILRSDNAEHLLLHYSSTSNGTGVRNGTYDNQQQVAEAIGDAYRAGEISDADLRNFLERIGPEKANEFILTLNSDPNNTQSNGVIEAAGKQAQSLGYDQAAALAFTSSEALINRNLPDEASQRAAFDQVRSFIDNSHFKDDPGAGIEGGGEFLRSEFTFAVANAARLTARGTGYSQGDFDNLLKDLGPTMTNEVIARSSSVLGDRAAGRALEVLGRASQRIAAGEDGDDKTQWEVNQYTAFTQSPSLINNNLTTPAERTKAFDVLNHELERSREDVDLALERDFSLLSQPIEANGITQLLEIHGTEILDAKLGESGTNYEGQADVVQFLQSTLYSPITDPALANRIKNVVGDYIDSTFSNAQNGDIRAGERIGALMGLHDVAFQRAYEKASTPEQRSAMEKLQVEVVKTVLSKASAALLAPTGPVGSTVGGFVTGQLLNELFKDRTPSASQLGAEFLKLLEEKGIDIDDASNYRDNLNSVIQIIVEGLDKQLRAGNLTQEQVDNVQNALNTLTRIQSNFRDRAMETYGEYDRTNGKLREALNDW